MKCRYLTVMMIIFLGVTGCSSVTINPNGGETLRHEPSYIDSKPFYFWGIKGSHVVNVNDICEGDVAQMKTVLTPSEYLIGLFTLFIYSPRTVKVWCEDEL